MLYDLPDDINYVQWSWLLNKYPIAYRTSATELLQPALPGKAAPNRVLGIFPEFNNTSRYLKYTKDEADEMRRYLDGNYLSKEKATKHAFLANIARYSIIHLSTHADAGDLYVPPSISFIDTALYLPEIYGLAVENKLMVLSACETGIGKLYTGESAMSLANGFVQAGVNNIVFSLWKVNDFSTSRLMANFYHHYTDKQPAYMALRNSKLDYLKDEKVDLAYKSPYFWAPFVYYGNTDVETANILWITSPVAIVLFTICLSILIFLLYRGFRNRI